MEVSMKKRDASPIAAPSLRLTLLGVLLVPALAFAFGGWAVVTVDDLPDYFVAGKATDLSFAVRQHGMSPLANLSPRVLMKSGDTEIIAEARPGTAKGHYVASLTPPRAADWSVRILSGFGPSENTLLPIRAIAAGAQPPSALAGADRGHRLFFAKGCVTCHVRGSEGMEGIKAGPDLTGRKYPPDYVAAFLADPEKSPLSRQTTGFVKMPKLDLKDREIASLVAFLNSEGQLSKTPSR
jgi:mono/diheme cytochrome c family protein